jgi:hypothetical protein
LWDNPSNDQYYRPKTLPQTLCATNQGDGISYCGAEINYGQNTFKLTVPVGDYILTGKYRFVDYQSRETKEFKTLYSVQSQQSSSAGYQYNADDYKKNAVVHVDQAGVLTNFNISVIFPDGYGYYGGGF